MQPPQSTPPHLQRIAMHGGVARTYLAGRCCCRTARCTQALTTQNQCTQNRWHPAVRQSLGGWQGLGSWLVRCWLVRCCLAGCCLAGWCLAGWCPTSLATGTEQAEQVERDFRLSVPQIDNDRLMLILHRRPHFGTAFDRVYQSHAAGNSLDSLITSLRDQANSDPDDYSAMMLAGMFELHRGRQQAAIPMLTAAQQRRPDDAVAAWYLGKAFAMDGQLQSAADWLKQAISQQPARSDLLQIAAELGDVYDRLRQPERAVTLWQQLEQAFPDDVRVAEWIADSLARSGQWQQAVQRFDRLANITDEPARRTQLAIRAAMLVAGTGDTSGAIQRLQDLQSELRPESWLYRDIYSRIEQILLSSGDAAAVATYYRDWLQKHPEDQDAVVRLAAALQQTGQNHDALAVLQTALPRWPGSRVLRQQLIDVCVSVGDWQQALLLHQQWHTIEPDNLDQLEAWGLLSLQAAMQNEGSQVLQMPSPEDIRAMMLQAAPDDAAVRSRVAKFLLKADRIDAAVQEFQKAVQLAPLDPLYKEQLGEVLWSLNRHDQAVAVWQSMATGQLRHAENLEHLSEVFRRFGLTEQALQAAAQANALKPSVEGFLKVADLLTVAGRFDEASLAVDSAQAMAERPDQRQRIMNVRVTLLQAAGNLTEEIAKLSARLQAGHEVGAPLQPDENADIVLADQWQQLALYQEAAGQSAAAVHSVRQALLKNQQSVPLWTLAENLHESQLQFTDAVTACRRLLHLDRNNAFDYLTRIITLHERAGRLAIAGGQRSQDNTKRQEDQLQQQQHRDAALAAIDELLQVFPDMADAWQFAADMQLQLGQPTAGLQTFRTAVLRFPSQWSLQLAYGYALMNFGSVAEAKEFWWQLYHRTGTQFQTTTVAPDAKAEIISQDAAVESLAVLYQRSGDVEMLIQQLRDEAKTPTQQRQATLQTATVWITTGNTTLARQTLQSLVTDDHQDVALLRRLVRLCQQEENLTLAIQYQRRIYQLQSSTDELGVLSELLLQAGSDLERTGDGPQACRLYAQVLQQDPARFAANFETHLQSFEFADQLPLLGRTLAESDLTVFSQDPGLLVWLAVRLHSDPQTAAVGKQLAASMLTHMPERQDQIRQQLLQRGENLD